MNYYFTNISSQHLARSHLLYFWNVWKCSEDKKTTYIIKHSRCFNVDWMDQWIFFVVGLTTSTDLEILQMNSGLVNSLQISWYFPFYLTLPFSLYTFQLFDLFSRLSRPIWTIKTANKYFKEGQFIFKHIRLFCFIWQ